MSNKAETFTHNGWGVSLFWEQYPFNPRKEYDHESTMLCEHNRYRLGDEDAGDIARAAVRKSRDYRDGWENDYPERGKKFDLSDPLGLWAAVQECSDIVSLPLYLYDHAGITMSTGSFSCPWDSGQVGFIFMTKRKILETFDPSGRRRMLTTGLQHKARECMRAEVVEYDQYLTGDVYSVVVHTPDNEDDEKESLSGVYGMEYAREEGKRMADAMETYVETEETADAE